MLVKLTTMKGRSWPPTIKSCCVLSRGVVVSSSSAVSVCVTVAVVVVLVVPVVTVDDDDEGVTNVVEEITGSFTTSTSTY
jgi:putative exporter of polyketide antibiotics